MALGAVLSPFRFHGDVSPATMHREYQRLYHETYYDLVPNGFLITRSGALGEQAVNTCIWPGDLDSNFTTHADGRVGGLPAAIAGGLSLSVSGYPFYGSDIGGFRKGLPTTELLARWSEYAALGTIMQLGGGGKSHNPWDTSLFAASALPHYRGYARLHTDLFPTIYSYAVVASQTGRPVTRPLGIAFADDPATWNRDFTFMLGDYLLVAPVIEEGATSRKVYLPQGAVGPSLEPCCLRRRQGAPGLRAGRRASALLARGRRRRNAPHRGRHARARDGQQRRLVRCSPGGAGSVGVARASHHRDDLLRPDRGQADRRRCGRHARYHSWGSDDGLSFAVRLAPSGSWTGHAVQRVGRRQGVAERRRRRGGCHLSGRLFLLRRCRGASLGACAGACWQSRGALTPGGGRKWPCPPTLTFLPTRAIGAGSRPLTRCSPCVGCGSIQRYGAPDRELERFRLPASAGRTAVPAATAGEHYVQEGTVKWFNDTKGFGFITSSDGGPDVFVHHTAIEAEGFRSLTEGERVQFEVKEGPKGLQATCVRRV